MKSKLFVLQDWINQTGLPVLQAIVLAATVLTIPLQLASCSSLGKPERQPSPVAPSCNQREPAIDSGEVPTGEAETDWMAWALAYVQAQWAVVDRDNKRAATADCLDQLAGEKR